LTSGRLLAAPRGGAASACATFNDMKRVGPRRARAVLALALLLVACGGPGARTPVAAALFETSYPLLDGGSSSLRAHAGKPMLVNFFAKSCGPCVSEMPALEQIHREFGDRVVFVGIDTQEKADAGREIVAQTGVTYEVGNDPAGTFIVGFGGLGLPTTVLVAADGTVADKHIGALSATQLRSMINKAFF